MPLKRLIKKWKEKPHTIRKYWQEADKQLLSRLYKEHITQQKDQQSNQNIEQNIRTVRKDSQHAHENANQNHNETLLHILLEWTWFKRPTVPNVGMTENIVANCS